MSPEPTALDLRIRDVVAAALAPYRGAYDLAFFWSDAARMWFAEVAPHRAGAADMSIGHGGGGGDLSVAIASSHLEVWGVTSDADVERIGRAVAAVAAGRVEETGRPKDASVRVLHEDGRVILSGGPVRLPWPWAWRRVRTFEPYA